MNNKGRHWIKGQLRGEKKGEQAYCSLGGIYAVTKPGPIRDASIIALADIIDPERMRQVRLQIAMQKASSPYVVSLVRQAEYIITDYNDARARRWSNVSGTFRRAAKAVVA